MRAILMLVLALPLALAGCEGGTTGSQTAAFKPAAPPVAAYTGDRSPLTRKVSIGHEVLDDTTGSIRESVTITGASGKVIGKSEAAYAFRQRFTKVTEGEAVTFWFSNPVETASGSVPGGLDPRRLSQYGEGAVVRFLLDRDKQILDAVAAAGPRGPNREPGGAEIAALKTGLHHAFGKVPKGKLVSGGDIVLDLSGWAKAAWGRDATLQYKATGWTIRDRRPVLIGDLKPGRDGTRISGYALIDMRTGAITEMETVAQFPGPGDKGSSVVVHSKMVIQIGEKK